MSTKKNDIVQAAIKLFSFYGYHMPSIDSICEEANVSKMTFYRHFKDKNDLIDTVLNEKKQSFLKVITNIEQQEICVKDKLFSIFQFYEQWFKSEDFNGCLFSRALFEAGNTNPNILKINQSFRNEMLCSLRRILNQVIKPEAAERVSIAILMLIDGAIIAQGSHRGSIHNSEYPPSLLAWQSSKALIYAEGGVLV